MYFKFSDKSIAFSCMNLNVELMMLFMNFYFHDDILLGFENDVFSPLHSTSSLRFDEIFDDVPK